MKAQEFRKLFRVRFVHTFFEHGQCTCFSARLAENSKKIDKRWKLKLLADTDGFSCYMATGNAPEALLTYIQRSTQMDYLDFYLNNSDPEFMLYTELPESTRGSLQFSCTGTGGGHGEEPALLAMGPCSDLHAPAFACLKLTFAHILANLQRKDPCFELRFRARETQWHYYIINRSKLKLQALEIQTDSDIGFDGPEEVRLANGQEALWFSSGEHRLPFSEIPRYSFRLVNRLSLLPERDARTTRVLFKGLPNADPAKVAILSDKGGACLYSPMYIYI